nr:acetyltransferase [Clostridium sp.]
MNKKLLLIGGGGHCKSVIDSILAMEYYSEIGIIDKNSNIGNNILGIPIIGCDNDLLKLYESGYNNAFVTVGSIGNPSTRIRLFHDIKKIGFNIPNIIDPTSSISKHITLEEGIYIGKNAVINAGSYIKISSIINTGSIIEHDCFIGEFSHISPGSVLCGGVHIGDNTHIGAKSVIRQQINVGNNTIIGIGSVVLKNIPDNVIAYGNPCKEVGIL